MLRDDCCLVSLEVAFHAMETGSRLICLELPAQCGRITGLVCMPSVALATFLFQKLTRGVIIDEQ
jgi:hypothetical protein